MSLFHDNAQIVDRLCTKVSAFARSIETAAQVTNDDDDNPTAVDDFGQHQNTRLRTIETQLGNIASSFLTNMTMRQLTQLLEDFSERQDTQMASLQQQSIGHRRPTSSRTLWSVGRPLHTVDETDNESEDNRTPPQTITPPEYLILQSERDLLEDELQTIDMSMDLVSRASRDGRPSLESEERKDGVLTMMNDTDRSKDEKKEDLPSALKRIRESLLEIEMSLHDTSMLRDPDAFEENISSVTDLVKSPITGPPIRDEVDETEATHAENNSNDDDELETTRDDSALYCPTILFNRGIRGMTQVHNTPSNRSHLTDIEIDTSLPSPAPTDITMDMTQLFLNETATGRLNDDTSVGSEETPVLDRYRVDADDESPHGFRVVPNPRGVRRRRAIDAARQPRVRFQTESSILGISEPTMYRKTPYRVAKMTPTTTTIDENVPINHATTDRPVWTSPIEDRGSTSNLGRRRFQSIPASISYSTRSKATADSDPIRAYRMAPVSWEEYEDAPRVIRMQVSYEELRLAIAAWNHRPVMSRSVSDEVASKMLGLDDAKSRKVMMALCHFRRLVMRRHSLSGESSPSYLVFELPSNADGPIVA